MLSPHLPNEDIEMTLSRVSELLDGRSGIPAWDSGPLIQFSS